MSPRGRRPVPGRGEEIMDVALTMVAEVGYAAVTIDAVVARARASKTTVYRRWADKRALVAAAMGTGPRAQPFDVPDTGSLRGDLIAYARALAAVIDGFEGRLILGMSQAVLEDAALRASVQERSKRIAPQLDRRVLERARERGELRSAEQPPILGEVASSLLVYRLVCGLPVDDLFVAHLVDDILLPALRHGGGPAGP
ncbi:TetR/AcrR family transcriptional regulator [Virgisporangium aliadipatigenens]|nr:TetR/AcrR family transcriptional regulator [Virgisporangium aliadipatigenens]